MSGGDGTGAAARTREANPGLLRVEGARGCAGDRLQRRHDRGQTLWTRRYPARGLDETLQWSASGFYVVLVLANDGAGA